MSGFLGFSLKDWIIVVVSTILVASLLEIRRLKKTIVQEVQRKFIPQLFVEIDEKERCFFLTNSSSFLAQGIVVEDVEVAMDDYGFQKKLTLKFETPAQLKPRERVKMSFRVYDKNFFLADVTEKIFLHLVPASFRMKISYATIEGLKLAVTFSKEANAFLSEGIEFFA